MQNQNKQKERYRILISHPVWNKRGCLTVIVAKKLLLTVSSLRKGEWCCLKSKRVSIVKGKWKNIAHFILKFKV